MALDPKGFGRRLIERRKELGLSQSKLAKRLGTSVSALGRYERAEMTPSVEVAARLAQELNTTVGYLLGETDLADFLKEPAMIRRLDALKAMDGEDQHIAFRVLDALIQEAKLRRAYSS